MAGFNGFPATYQPMYYAPQYQQPTQANNNSLIWVQGEAGAKSYLVAPNTTVQLWDSEAQVIYLKSADASGMPSMKILDYTIREQSASNAPTSASNATLVNTNEYATHAEIDALTAQINALKAQVESLTSKRKKDADHE